MNESGSREDQNQETLTIPKAELADLLLSDTREQLKKDLKEWAIRELTLITLFGVISIGVVVALAIKTPIDLKLVETQVRLDDAKEDADKADKTFQAIKDSSDKYQKGWAAISEEVSILGFRIDSLSITANKVDRLLYNGEQLVAELKAAADNQSGMSKIEQKNVLGRLEALENALSDIGDDKESDVKIDKIIQAYEQRIQSLESKIKQERLEFIKNSDYRVTIGYFDSTETIALKAVDSLRNLGFKVQKLKALTEDVEGVESLRWRFDEYWSTVKIDQLVNSLYYTQDAREKAAEIVATLRSIGLSSWYKNGSFEQAFAGANSPVPPKLVTAKNRIDIFIRTFPK